MEYFKSICQSNDPNLPFYISSFPRKFVNMFGRYYFNESNQRFRIFDEETGLIFKEVEDINDFKIDNNYNIILSIEQSQIKYLSFNGDLLKEIKLELELENILIDLEL